MKTCSNCYAPIINDEDIVYSIVDQAPMHKGCANKCESCGAYLTDLQFIRNKCKCVTQRKSTIDIVRRSHIELYKKCRHAFYLECVKGVEPQNNAYALHGIILHEIFDKYSKKLKINKEHLMNDFLNRYDEEVKETNWSFAENKTLRDELRDKGERAIDGFMAFHESVELPFITEENILFEVGEGLPKVSITMDRVDKDEAGNLHMYDYKCGKTFVGKKLSEDLQVPLYCYAMYKQYGSYPKSFTFLFVSEDTTRRYELTDEQVPTYVCKVRNKAYTVVVEDKLEETRSILKNIQDEKYKGMCSNLFHCSHFCYHKHVGNCSGAENNIWNVL